MKETLPKFITRGREHDKVGEQNDLGSNNEDISASLLVLMSFADRVLAEIMDENGGKCDKVIAKQEVKEHFEVGPFILCLVTVVIKEFILCNFIQHDLIATLLLLKIRHENDNISPNF